MLPGLEEGGQFAEGRQVLLALFLGLRQLRQRSRLGGLALRQLPRLPRRARRLLPARRRALLRFAGRDRPAVAPLVLRRSGAAARRATGAARTAGLGRRPLA